MLKSLLAVRADPTIEWQSGIIGNDCVKWWIESWTTLRRPRIIISQSQTSPQPTRGDGQEKNQRLKSKVGYAQKKPSTEGRGKFEKPTKKEKMGGREQDLSCSNITRSMKRKWGEKEGRKIDQPTYVFEKLIHTRSANADYFLSFLSFFFLFFPPSPPSLHQFSPPFPYLNDPTQPSPDPFLRPSKFQFNSNLKSYSFEISTQLRPEDIPIQLKSESPKPPCSTQPRLFLNPTCIVYRTFVHFIM